MQASPEKSLATGPSGSASSLGGRALFSGLGDGGLGQDSVEWLCFSACNNNPPGPISNSERMQWASHVWSGLSANQKDLLIANLRSLSASSAFSGVGGLEMILFLIWLECEKHSPGLPPVSTFSSCDAAVHCRRVLLSFDSAHRPEHVGCNILDRLPQDVRSKVDALLPSPDSHPQAKRFAYMEVFIINNFTKQ